MLIVCLIHYSALSVAGGDNHNLSARSTAMGGAGVTLLDLWAVHYNQAGLAGIEAITAGVYYDNRFALKELSVKGVALALPLPGTGQNVLGVSMSYFGYSEYNDSKVGLAYGKKLGDKYSVGIQLNYIQTKIGRDYGLHDASCLLHPAMQKHVVCLRRLACGLSNAPATGAVQSMSVQESDWIAEIQN